MTDASFKKVGRSDQRLYGERKILLCGFSPAAQSKFKALLEMLGVKKLPLVWAGPEDSDELVGQLLQRADGSGEGSHSPFHRTLIVAGIEEKELHLLMSGCRKAGMKKAFWAALTPTSEGWPLKTLIAELSAERNTLAKSAGKN